jgi:hypothetical protein
MPTINWGIGSSRYQNCPKSMLCGFLKVQYACSAAQPFKTVKIKQTKTIEDVRNNDGGELLKCGNGLKIPKTTYFFKVWYLKLYWIGKTRYPRTLAAAFTLIEWHCTL